MAVLFAASADYNDLSLWDTNASVTRTSTAARTGAFSYFFGASTAAVSKYLPGAYSELYVKFALKLGNRFMLYMYDNTAIISSITFGFGGLKVFRGLQTSVLLASVLDAVPTDWDCYEVYLKRSATIGVCQIKQNGVLVLNASNLNLGASDYNRVYFSPETSGSHYIDDIIVDDANWPGLGGIEVIRPNADGNYTGWSSGNYSNVADDSDATYVANDAETTAKDSYEVPALAADRRTPASITYLAKAQLSGAGAGTLRPFSRKDSVDTNGTSVALSTGLAHYRNMLSAYPDEIGLEVVV